MSHIILQDGLVVFLPIKESCMQSWQQPLVREQDDNGEWVDVKGQCCVVQKQIGETVSNL